MSLRFGPANLDFGRKRFEGGRGGRRTPRFRRPAVESAERKLEAHTFPHPNSIARRWWLPPILLRSAHELENYNIESRYNNVHVLDLDFMISKAQKNQQKRKRAGKTSFSSALLISTFSFLAVIPSLPPKLPCVTIGTLA